MENCAVNGRKNPKNPVKIEDMGTTSYGIL
jgi:hypothetical protein